MSTERERALSRMYGFAMACAEIPNISELLGWGAPTANDLDAWLADALRSDPPSTAERIEGELLADVIRAIGRQAEIFGGTALRRLEAKLEKPGTVLILGRAAPPPQKDAKP